MRGACNAEIAEDAVAPDAAEFTVCGRAVDIPVAASALPAGHRPLAGFFRAAQPAASVDVGAAPLVCGEDAVTVEVEELEELVEESDEKDDEEFCRWAVLRGPDVNILDTSSEFIAPKPLVALELHLG